MNTSPPLHGDRRVGPAPWHLLVDQTRYQLRTYTRSPVAMFFTVGLPTIMLVLFNAIFARDDIATASGTYNASQFFTGGLAAFTAVSASYTNLVNVVPIRRDEGVLKRWYTTPLPKWAFFGGWIASTLVLALAGVVLQLGVGTVLYGLRIPVSQIGPLVLVFVVGVGCFCSLGMAVAGLVPSAETAPAVANATILPLAFISDVFVGAGNMPTWLQSISGVFPLRAFAHSFQGLISPVGDADLGKHLLLMTLWGVGGLVLARMTFKWSPARGGSDRGRRTRRRSRSSG